MECGLDVELCKSVLIFFGGHRAQESQARSQSTGQGRDADIFTLHVECTPVRFTGNSWLSTVASLAREITVVNTQTPAPTPRRKSSGA